MEEEVNKNVEIWKKSNDVLEMKSSIKPHWLL
jgi:hypothetical protein